MLQNAIKALKELNRNLQSSTKSLKFGLNHHCSSPKPHPNCSTTHILVPLILPKSLLRQPPRCPKLMSLKGPIFNFTSRVISQRRCHRLDFIPKNILSVDPFLSPKHVLIKKPKFPQKFHPNSPVILLVRFKMRHFIKNLYKIARFY